MGRVVRGIGGYGSGEVTPCIASVVFKWVFAFAHSGGDGGDGGFGALRVARCHLKNCSTSTHTLYSANALFRRLFPFFW